MVAFFSLGDLFLALSGHARGGARTVPRLLKFINLDSTVIRSQVYSLRSV
jgi:hypothetical protein